MIRNSTRQYRSVHAANLAIIVLVLLVLGCSCQKFGDLLRKKSPESNSPTRTNSTPQPESTPTNETSGEDYHLTLATYEKIKIGMPRSAVEELLGGKGTEVSSSSGGGLHFTVNKWEGEDFRSIILTFKNDKVMTKSQVALK